MNISVSNNTTVTITKSEADKVRHRKYKDDYINFGFTWTGEKDNPKPQCRVFGVTLSNQSMVPNKLKRNLELNHKHVARKSTDYFRRLHSKLKKFSAMMGKRLKLSENALLALFKTAELIAKKKKAHNIGEKLILPTRKEIVEVILGSQAAKEISNVLLSNDTVHRRISVISTDIENNVLGKLQANKKFESTDVSGKAQLISVVRFVEGPE
jgi:hypothetical protein